MKSTPANPKKPYQKPILRVYGDIKELTKHIAGGGMADGGGGGLSMTA